MASFVIKDDCLAPERFIYLKYSGADPYGVVKKIDGMLKHFFHISSSGACQYDFRWDNSGNPRSFFIRWWTKKGMSNWSTAWYYFQVQGNVDVEKNEGDFNFEMSAEIKTKIGSKNPLFKAIWGVYSYVFYNKRRREYIQHCSNMAHSFRDELKEHYNLKIKGSRGGP